MSVAAHYSTATCCMSPCRCLFLGPVANYTLGFYLDGVGDSWSLTPLTMDLPLCGIYIFSSARRSLVPSTRSIKHCSYVHAAVVFHEAKGASPMVSCGCSSLLWLPLPSITGMDHFEYLTPLDLNADLSSMP